MEGGRNGDGLKYISACEDREFYRQYGDNLELQAQGRSSWCKRRTSNKSGSCDVRERLALSDQAFKHTRIFPTGV